MRYWLASRRSLRSQLVATQPPTFRNKTRPEQMREHCRKPMQRTRTRILRPTVPRVDNRDPGAEKTAWSSAELGCWLGPVRAT